MSIRIGKGLAKADEMSVMFNGSLHDIDSLFFYQDGYRKDLWNKFDHYVHFGLIGDEDHFELVDSLSGTSDEFGLGVHTCIADGTSMFAKNIQYISGDNQCSCLSVLDNAFRGYGQLRSISLPTVIRVGSCAFYNQQMFLSSVYFPHVKQIDGTAFRACYQLSVLDFPELENIGIEAFSSISNLLSAYLPSAKLENIQMTTSNRLFGSSSNLQYIDLRSNTKAEVTESLQKLIDDSLIGTCQISCSDGMLPDTPVFSTQWDEIVEALENASEDDFDKDTLEYTGDNAILQAIPVSSCVSVAYQVNDNDDSSIVSAAWLNLGFNASIPEYVKYKDSDGNKVYVHALSNDYLSSIAVGHEIYAKSWDEDNLSNVYETNGEKVAAVDGSFSYGNNNPYTVPTSLTSDSGKVYTFCGYNITLNQRDIMLDTTPNANTVYTYVYFDKDSSSNRWSAATKLRSFLNDKTGTADGHYADADRENYGDYTINSLVSKVASEDGFLKNITKTVNRTWVYGGSEDTTADRFWLLGNGNINHTESWLKDVDKDTSKFSTVFADTTSARIKSMMTASGGSGDAGYWWLRLASFVNSTNVGYVGSGGIVNYTGAYNDNGVAAACLIG